MENRATYLLPSKDFIGKTLNAPPRSKKKVPSASFLKFRSDLAALYLLPDAEIEKRWKEVEKKNTDKMARGIRTNPLHR